MADLELTVEHNDGQRVVLSLKTSTTGQSVHKKVELGTGHTVHLRMPDYLLDEDAPVAASGAARPEDFRKKEDDELGPEAREVKRIDGENKVTIYDDAEEAAKRRENADHDFDRDAEEQEDDKKSETKVAKSHNDDEGESGSAEENAESAAKTGKSTRQSSSSKKAESDKKESSESKSKSSGSKSSSGQKSSGSKESKSEQENK